MKTYAAMSDLHGFLPDPDEVPEVNFLFLPGDIWPYTNHALGFQYEWGKYTLGPWLEKVNERVDYVVATLGNHDFLGQTPYGKTVLRGLPWTCLLDETITLDGVRIHGSPWTPTFFDWAFMDSDWQLMQYWNKIPGQGVDVLLTHGPAHGVCDRTVQGMNVGSESLKARLEQIPAPQVHLVGHIHCARGTHGGFADVPLTVNVAHVNEGYNPVHPIFTGTLD